MVDCFTLCQRCDAPIGSREIAHLYHENCDRFLGLECRCDGWVCARCCPDEECSPLQEAMLLAREDTYARAEAWEAAQTAPSPTERADAAAVAHPLSGFYFGGVG